MLFFEIKLLYLCILYASPKGGGNWYVYFLIIYLFIYLSFNYSSILSKKVLWWPHHTGFNFNVKFHFIKKLHIKKIFLFLWAKTLSPSHLWSQSIYMGGGSIPHPARLSINSQVELHGIALRMKGQIAQKEEFFN